MLKCKKGALEFKGGHGAFTWTLKIDPKQVFGLVEKVIFKLFLFGYFLLKEALSNYFDKFILL